RRVRQPPSAEIASARFLSCQQGSALPRLLLPRHLVRVLTVNESQPTPPNVRPRTAKVPEEGGVGAAGFFQGVGQNGQRGEVTLLVHLASEGDGGVGAPGEGKGNRAEWVTEDVTQVDRRVGGVSPDRRRDPLRRDRYEVVRVVAEGGVGDALGLPSPAHVP